MKLPEWFHSFKSLHSSENAGLLEGSDSVGPVSYTHLLHKIIVVLEPQNNSKLILKYISYPSCHCFCFWMCVGMNVPSDLSDCSYEVVKINITNTHNKTT